METLSPTAQPPVYMVSCSLLPSPSLPSGTFCLSQTCPSTEPPGRFSCILYNEQQQVLAQLSGTPDAGLSNPILLADIIGESLILELQDKSSNKAKQIFPLDFSQKGGLTELDQTTICLVWTELPGDACNTPKDTPPESYLTGFDDHGVYFFLSYIPWIESHFIVAEPPSQSDQHALSGKYSCQFNEGTLGQSYIDTIALPVPAGSTHVVITFAIYLLVSGGGLPLHDLMLLDYYENGNKISSAHVNLYSKTPIDGWYNQQFTYNLSSSAVSTFKLMLSLNSTGHISGILTVDNLAINFVSDPPQAEDKMMVYSDESGSLYGLNAYTGERRWTFSGQSNFLSSSIFILREAAYVADGNSKSNIYAINVANGTRIWQTALQGSMYCAPVLSGELLIAGCSNGYIYALNQQTGNIVWSANFYQGNQNDPAGAVGYVNGMAPDNHGRIYLATDTGIFALDANTQQSLWYHSTTKTVPFAPALTEDEAVYGDVAGNIVGLNKTTGSVKWSAVSPAPINSQPYLIGGVVVIGNDGGSLMGYDAATGQKLWSLDFPGTMIRSFNVDGPYLYFTANAIYASCYCYTYSIDLNGIWTFSQQWKVPVSLGAQCSPLIAHDMAYYTLSNQNLVALGRTSGTTIWDFTSGSIGFASPAAISPQPIPTLTSRYDQYCYLVAHNAFANVDDGWTYAQQTHSITQQLDMGARGLELDIYRRQVNGVDEVVYDHSGMGNWRVLLRSPWKLLRDSLSEIRNWMDNHPAEVLTIIFEQPDFTNPDPMVTAAFTAAGMATYVYYANQVNYGKNGATWNNRTQGWPSLQWMIDNGKRLVVFSQRSRGNTTGFAYLWDYAVENEYGTPSILSGCEKRAESGDLNQNAGKLFVVNYALNIPTSPTTIPLPSTYTLLNNYYWLYAKLRTCQDVSSNNALPNLVKVNFFEYGAGGGPLRVIQKINQEWGH